MAGHIDSEYAICPYCGEKHGDCFEWLTSEDAKFYDCQECGKSFIAWAEHDVTYHTKTRPSKEIVDKLKEVLCTDTEAK